MLSLPLSVCFKYSDYYGVGGIGGLFLSDDGSFLGVFAFGGWDFVIRCVGLGSFAAVCYWGAVEKLEIVGEDWSP